MTMKAFKMFVSYSQIAVFDGTIQKPFNNWTKPLVRQGFAWRPNSVSFKTLIESGTVDVEFVIVANFFPDVNAVRAISVPFVVHHGAQIEISTISESSRVDLNAGNYQLIFETGRSADKNWCRFSARLDGML